MKLRPYQQEFVGAVLRDFQEHKRLLGVAATGAGKTILASELMHRAKGRCLFLADAKELVWQNADKFHKHTGSEAEVEMGEEHATGKGKVVVATTQSMARRLDKYSRDFFSLIIVDEAHRNTLGAQAAQVLGHFDSAKTLGVTATPFRSDRKQLGSFYEKVSVEITLPRLIEEGFLSPITIKSVPLNLALDAVRTTAGDYRADDLGVMMADHLEEAAKALLEHAPWRKTVVFVPLIETSLTFTAACRSLGINAVHVDGNDRAGIEAFAKGRHDVIVNASLLTTGWDCPHVDCVYPLRPTKSLSLFQQMVGRGTRLCEGKKDLLLLDPLFLTDDHALVKSARLIAGTEEEAAVLQELLNSGEEVDLLESEAEAKEIRRSRLEEELRRKARRTARTIDALEFALSLGNLALAEYAPELAWESEELTDKQREILSNNGFDVSTVKCKGHASKILNLLFSRRAQKLATPKQVKLLKQWGVKKAYLKSFNEASVIITERLNKKPAA
jgi:superfamily II DNA or RNA helicase